MAFNPDEWLKQSEAPAEGGGFDPDAWLSQNKPAPSPEQNAPAQAQGFDPDAWLSENQPTVEDAPSPQVDSLLQRHGIAPPAPDSAATSSPAAPPVEPDVRPPVGGEEGVLPEGTLRNLPAAVGEVLRPVPELAKGLARGTERIAGSVGNIGQWASQRAQQGKGLPLPARIIDKIAQRVIPRYGRARSEQYARLNNMFADVSDFWDEQAATGIEARDPELTFKAKPFSTAAAGVGEALPLFSAAVATSALTKSPVPAAMLFGMTGGADTFTEARKKGTAMNKADVLATMSGAWEGLSESIPFGKLLGRAGQKAVSRIVKGAITEGTQEVVQEIGTNLIEKFGFDRYRAAVTMDSFLNSLVVGMLLGGGAGAVVKGGADEQAVKERVAELMPPPVPQDVAATEEVQDAEAIPIPEAEIRPEEGGEDIRGEGQVEAIPQPAGEAVEARLESPVDELTVRSELPGEPEAVVVPPSPEDLATMPRSELQARADELGLRTNGRESNKGLRDKIVVDDATRNIDPPTAEKSPLMDDDAPRRRFAEQVLGDEDVSDDVKQAMQDVNYTPKSNELTAKEADALITARGDLAATDLVRDKNNGLAPRVRVFMGHRLIRAFNLKGNMLRQQGLDAEADAAYAQSANIADDMARFGTISGQGVQAYSMWSRVTPEGIVRFTQNQLKSSGDGKTSLTPEEVERLSKKAQDAQDAPEGFQRNKKIVDLLSDIDTVLGGKSDGRLWSIWYANILSGYKTHQRNVIDTTLNVLHDVPINAIVNKENPIRAIGEMLRGVYSKGFVEGGSVMKGGTSRFEGHEKLAATTGNRVGQDPLEARPFKGGRYNPFNYWKFVGRAMKGEDAVLYAGAAEAKAWIAARKIAKDKGLRGAALNREVEKLLGRTDEQQQAFREQADQEGLTGLDKARRVAELSDQAMPEDVQAQSSGFAARATYNYDPKGIAGIIAKNVSNITKQVPGARLVVPFTRIVANVFNRGIDYTPWGYVRAYKGYTGDGKPSQEQRHESIAKATLGTAAMAVAYLADAMNADDDDPKFAIYGSGPSDRDQRNQLRQSGWRPYSVKIGDKYYDYRLTPYNVAFAIVGNLRDRERFDNMSEEDALTRATAAVTLSGQAIMNQSFLTGLQDFFEMMSRDDYKSAATSMQRFAARGATSFAAPNLLKQIDQAMDPSLTEAKDLKQFVMREIPFARRRGRAMINALGEPVKRNVGLIVSEQLQDPVWGLLAEKNATLRPPSEHGTKIGYGDKRRALTQDEYYRYVKESGQELRKRIERDMRTLSGYTDEQFADWLHRNTASNIKGSSRYIVKAKITRAMMHQNRN